MAHRLTSREVRALMVAVELLQERKAAGELPQNHGNKLYSPTEPTMTIGDLELLKRRIADVGLANIPELINNMNELNPLEFDRVGESGFVLSGRNQKLWVQHPTRFRFSSYLQSVVSMERKLMNAGMSFSREHHYLDNPNIRKPYNTLTIDIAVNLDIWSELEVHIVDYGVTGGTIRIDGVTSEFLLSATPYPEANIPWECRSDGFHLIGNDSPEAFEAIIQHKLDYNKKVLEL